MTWIIWTYLGVVAITLLRAGAVQDEDASDAEVLASAMLSVLWPLLLVMMLGAVIREIAR